MNINPLYRKILILAAVIISVLVVKGVFDTSNVYQENLKKTYSQIVSETKTWLKDSHSMIQKLEKFTLSNEDLSFLKKTETELQRLQKIVYANEKPKDFSQSTLNKIEVLELKTLRLLNELYKMDDKYLNIELLKLSR